MQTSTRYTALIIGLVVLTLGLTACGDSPTRAEFEALEQQIQSISSQLASGSGAVSQSDLVSIKRRLNTLDSFTARTRELACDTDLWTSHHKQTRFVHHDHSTRYVPEPYPMHATARGC